jgi:hypothetical protein
VAFEGAYGLKLQLAAYDRPLIAHQVPLALLERPTKYASPSPSKVRLARDHALLKTLGTFSIRKKIFLLLSHHEPQLLVTEFLA